MVGKVVLAWISAYLLGSIPPGLLWAWVAQRIDVRQHGSGRTGGTNVWRTAGFWPALITAICDALKGAAAISVARALGLDTWAIAIAGTMAIVGHNYSIFLKFRGGAGTAASIGVAAALAIFNLPILIALGILAGLLVGHASVASVLIALMLPALCLIRGDIACAVGFGLPTMTLTLWALRPNIQRLLKREERFLPMYLEKPPLIRLSRHPQQKRSQS